MNSRNSLVVMSPSGASTISKEQWQVTRDCNIGFWGAWGERDPQFEADDYLRRILAEDIAAARFFGDAEAEQEFLKVDLDKPGTGDPEARARAHNSLPADERRRQARRAEGLLPLRGDCDCQCHEPGSSMLHCFPCCED
jgi:hypothetical protein